MIEGENKSRIGSYDPKLDNPITDKENKINSYVPVGSGAESTVYDTSLEDSQDQFSNYEPIGGNLEKHSSKQADLQSGFEQLGNAFNQAIVGEVVGGTIEGIGYLLDIPQYINLAKGTEQEFGNALSDIGKDIKNWTREATPIHETASPGEFAPDKWSWWMSNAPTIASSFSLLIPSAGAVKGLGALGKILNLSNKTDKLTDMLSTGIGQAVISRHMENLMESSGTFETLLEDYKQRGFSEDKAREFAAKGASDSYAKNWIMLAQDIPQYMMLGSTFGTGASNITSKMAKGLGDNAMAKSIAMSNAQKFATTMISEGFEEAYQFVIDKEAMHKANVLAGIEEEGNFTDRMSEYTKDGELWTSAFFGALGAGAMQSGLGKTINESILKARGKHVEDDVDTLRVKNIKSYGTKFAQHAKSMITASASDSPMAESRTRRNYIIDATIEALNHNNKDQFFAFLDQLSKVKNQEEYDALLGSTGNEMSPSAIASIPSLIEIANNIANKYKDNYRKHDRSLVGHITSNEVRLDLINKDISELRSKKSELEKNIPLKNELSALGSELYSRRYEIARLNKIIRHLELMKSSDDFAISKEERALLPEKIKKFRSEVRDLRKEAASILKEDARTDLEKSADKVVIDSIENQNKLLDIEVALSQAIELAGSINESLKELKDPNFSKKINEKLKNEKKEFDKAEALKKAKDAKDAEDLDAAEESYDGASDDINKATNKEISEIKPTTNENFREALVELFEGKDLAFKAFIDDYLNPKIITEDGDPIVNYNFEEFLTKEFDMVEAMFSESLTNAIKDFNNELLDSKSTFTNPIEGSENNGELDQSIPFDLQQSEDQDDYFIYGSEFKTFKFHNRVSKKNNTVEFGIYIRTENKFVPIEEAEKLYNLDKYIIPKTITGKQYYNLLYSKNGELIPSVSKDSKIDYNAVNQPSILPVGTVLELEYSQSNNVDYLNSDYYKSKVAKLGEKEAYEQTAIVYLVANIQGKKIRVGKLPAAKRSGDNLHKARVALLNGISVTTTLEGRKDGLVKYNVGEPKLLSEVLDTETIRFGVGQNNDLWFPGLSEKYTSSVIKIKASNNHLYALIPSEGKLYPSRVLIQRLDALPELLEEAYSIISNMTPDNLKESYEKLIEIVYIKKPSIVNGELIFHTKEKPIATKEDIFRQLPSFWLNVNFNSLNTNSEYRNSILSSGYIKTDLAVNPNPQGLDYNVNSNLVINSKFNYNTNLAESTTNQSLQEKKADIEKRRQEELKPYDERDKKSLDAITPNNPNHPTFYVGKKYHKGDNVIVEDWEDNRTKNEDGYEVIISVKSPAEFDSNGKMTKSAKVKVGIFDSKESADKAIQDKFEKVKSRVGLKQQKINAKYDAELKALEESTSTQSTQAKKAEIEKRGQESFKDLPLENKGKIDSESPSTTSISRDGVIPFDAIDLGGVASMFGEEETPENEDVKAVEKKDEETKPEKIEASKKEPIVSKIEKKESATKKKKAAYTHQDEIDWFKKSFPNVPIKVLNNLRTIGNNGGEVAYGMFYKAAVSLLDNAPEGTLYHEAFHVIFRLYTKPGERVRLLNIIKNKIGETNEVKLDKLKKLHPQLSKAELLDLYYEEELADEFSKYMLNKKVNNNILVKFFNTILEFINSIFDIPYNNTDSYFRKYANKIFNTELPKNKSFSGPVYSISQFSPTELDNRILNINNAIFTRINVLAKDPRYEGMTEVEIIKDYGLEQIYGDVFMFILRHTRKQTDPNIKLLLNKTLENILYISDKDAYSDIIANNPTNVISEAISKKAVKFGDLTYYSMTSLANYGIKVNISENIDPEDSLELSEDIRDFENWQLESVSVDPRDKMSVLVKSKLRLLPREHINGKSMKDDVGLNSYIEFEPFYNSLQHNLSNIFDPNLIYDKIVSLSRGEDNTIRKPEYYTLRRELDKDPVFKAQFMSHMMQSHTDFYKVSYSKKQKKNVLIKSNRNSAKQVTIDEWKNNFDRKFRSSTNTVKSGTLNELISELDLLVERINIEKPKKDHMFRLIGLADKLGIKLDFDLLVDNFSRLTNSEAAFKRFINGSSSIKTLAEAINSGRDIYGESKLFAIVNKISKYGKLEANKLTQESFLNAEKNLQYSHLVPNFFMEHLASLKDERSERLIENLMTDSFFRNSPWLKAINDKSSNAKDVLDYFIVDAYKGVNDSRDVRYKNMNKKHLLEFAFSAYDNAPSGEAYYMVPTLSDKPNSIFIKFRKYNLNDVINLMLSVERQEYSRIQEAKFIAEDYNTSDLSNFNKNALKYHLIPEMNNFKGERTIRSLRDYLKEVINNKIESEIKKFENIGAIEQGKNGYKIPSLNMQGNKANDFLYEYIANNILANTQIISIFGGDPAFYKDTTDFQKRIAQIWSNGIKLDTSAKYKLNAEQSVIEGSSELTVKDSYLSVFLNDNFISSKYVDQIRKSLQENTNYSKDKIDAIVSMYEIKSKNDEGVIQTDAQAYISIDRYREIMVGLGRWNDKFQNAFIRLKNPDDYELNIEDYKLIMQPIKPFYYGFSKRGDKIIPIQNKNSEVVLLPQMAKGSPELTKIIKLFEKGVSSVQFKSAIKVGAHNIVDLNNSSLENILSKSHVLSNNNYKLQQETPVKHLDASIILGTQFKKLIVGDLPNDAIFKIGNNSFTKDELIELYNSILNKDIEEANKELLSGGNLFEKNGSSWNVNYPLLKKMLIREIRRTGFDPELEKALEIIDGDFKVPAFYPLFNTKIENLIMSMFKKIRRQKIGGASLVQMSNFGYSNKLNINFNEDGSLASIDVMLPWWSKSHIPLDKFGNPDPSKLPQELKTLIGWRIPTEDKYSMVKMNVVGFTNPSMGGVVILPEEITKISGSDFDIDKLYVAIPQFDVEIDYEGLAKDIIDSGFSMGNTLESAVNKVKRLISPRLYNLSDRDLEIHKEIIKNISRFTNYKLITDSNTKAGRDNLKILIAGSILSHKSIAPNILEPGDFSILKTEADRISKIFSDETESSLDLSLQSTHLEIFDRNMAGAQLIGFFANHNSSHAVLQQYNISLGFDLPIEFGQNDDVFLNNIYNKNGERISRTLATFLAAMVDNAKDPLASKLNINKYTADVYGLLIRSGAPLIDTINYINQPVIRDFISVLEKKNATKMDINELYLEYKDNYFKNVNLDRIEADPSLYTESNGLLRVNSKALLAALTPKNKGKKYIELQGFLLKSFVNLINNADGLSAINAFTKIDSSNIPTLAEAEALDARLSELAISDEFSLFKNTNELFEKDSPYLKLYNTTIKQPLYLAEKIFPYYNELFTTIKNYIYSTQNLKLTAEKISVVNNNIVSYLASKHPYFQSLNHDDILVNLFKKIEKYIEENEDSPYNNLLRRLRQNTVTDGNTHPDYKGLKMQFLFSRLTKEEEHLLRRQWSSMYYDGNELEKEIASELIKYSFLTSGFVFNSTSFFNVMPYELLEEATSEYGMPLSDYMKKAVSIKDLAMTFPDEFFRNNYSDSRFVYNINNNNKDSLIMDMYVNKKGTVLELELNSKYMIVKKQYRTFVSLNESNGSVSLFRFIGVNNNNPVYVKTTRKGNRHFNELGLYSLGFSFINENISHIDTIDYKSKLMNDYEDRKSNNAEPITKNLLPQFNDKSSDSEINIVDFTPTISQSTEINPSVSELFGSNPELANQVYEALGFGQKNNLFEKNIFTVEPIQSVDKKAKSKAKIATQYIGFAEGITGSSTAEYAKQAGQYANTGSYTSNDVIFVSIGGKRGDTAIRKQQQDKTIREAMKALDAGATLITDNAAYVESNSYNEGEKRLATNLKAKGYNYSEVTVDGNLLGVWNKNKQSKITPQQKQQAQQLYSEYLDTIFPESKVKDIVYHGTDLVNLKNIKEEGFTHKNKDLSIKEYVFFARKYNAYGNDAYGVKDKVLIPAIVNSKNIQIVEDGSINNSDLNSIKKEGKDTLLQILFDINSYKNGEKLSYEELESIREAVENKGFQEILKNTKLSEKELANELENNFETFLENYINKFGTLNIPFGQLAVKPEQIHILFSKQDIEGFKKFVNSETNTQDNTLAQKIQDRLQKLYPEIKLNITNNPVWEQGDNIFNQEEYNNQVNYRLKAVDILSSDKAKQVFEKGAKNGWDLNKILTELQIPKEQKQIILDKGITNREEIITSLLADNSFVVEINTAKESRNQFGNDPNSNQTNEFFRLSDLYQLQGLTPIEADKKAREEIEKKELPNSQHYSNLTVPGGTNYTENEIATPAITPSIKGHAQFATDNGIGWFRSDDRQKVKSVGVYTKEQADKDLKEGKISEFEYEMASFSFGMESPIEIDTKTRRILEVQSDLFQKGRDKEDLITSDMDNKSISMQYENDLSVHNQELDFLLQQGEITFEEYKQQWDNPKIDKSKYPKFDKSKNQFLQLLNKDNNWVTFFIKSIIQDSVKKGYEKVLFPKGDTAAKIEGHQTLEEFKNIREREIKKSQEKIEEYDKVINRNRTEEDEVFGTPDIRKAEEQKKSALTYINTLKQEIADVESGQTQLSSIANFYETTVTNILKKNGYNPVEITDEYDNKWNEVSITQNVLSEILLQKDEADRIIGQANIKAGTVLIDAINQKEDTLAHEYAHHYIAWFRNSPIVQEGIKRFGSEEALVDAIGKQVVKQKGEAYNWWKKFSKWVLSLFSDQELLELLTDSFLNRVELETNTSFDVAMNSLLEKFNEISDREVEDRIKKCE